MRAANPRRRSALSKLEVLTDRGAPLSRPSAGKGEIARLGHVDGVIQCGMSNLKSSISPMSCTSSELTSVPFTSKCVPPD